MKSSSQILVEISLGLVLVSLWSSFGAEAASARSIRAADGASKVKLAVFFESKCPDSRNFFLDQLIPVYLNQSSIIDLKLVPFGKARVLSHDRMICQHGSLECQGNRFMACILSRSDNQTANLLTIGCMFDWNKSDQDCVEQFLAKTVDFKDLQRCSSSEESMRMMQENERLTGRISYVPRIEINSKTEPGCEHDLSRCIREAGRLR